MQIPTAKEIELLTAEAIAAVEVVSASEVVWPVEGFTKPFLEAYRKHQSDIDDVFERARRKEFLFPNLITLANSQRERPLMALLIRMQRLESSLLACKNLNVFTSLHSGQNQEYDFLDFVQQHSAKQRPHRYIVWDANEEQCCAFLTAHEVAFWWLAWVQNFEHYCQSHLFSDGREWWRNDPLSLCNRLESDAKCYSKSPRMDAENLKELIRDESMAMLSSVRRSPWNRRPGTSSTEWLTVPARFEVKELKVFIDLDGWPKLIRNGDVLPSGALDGQSKNGGTPDAEKQTHGLASEIIPDEQGYGFSRISPVVGRQRCEIDNPQQRSLFNAMLKAAGKLPAEVVRRIGTRQYRSGVVRRLNEKLGQLQLTIEYQNGGFYVLKEFQE